jgi:hypothetical protein
VRSGRRRLKLKLTRKPKLVYSRNSVLLPSKAPRSLSNKLNCRSLRKVPLLAKLSSRRRDRHRPLLPRPLRLLRRDLPLSVLPPLAQGPRLRRSPYRPCQRPTSARRRREQLPPHLRPQFRNPCRSKSSLSQLLGRLSLPARPRQFKLRSSHSSILLPGHHLPLAHQRTLRRCSEAPRLPGPFSRAPSRLRCLDMVRQVVRRPAPLHSAHLTDE